MYMRGRERERGRVKREGGREREREREEQIAEERIITACKLCSIKVETEIKEMRADYAQKKDSMLEKTRLVCTCSSTNVVCRMFFHYITVGLCTPALS